METGFDTIIVGAGLAGSCAARQLAVDRSVLLADAGDHDAASPAAAAALATPLMAQRARPMWRAAEALAAFERLVDELAVGDPHARSGLVRAPSTSRQAEEYRAVARERPELAEFWSSGETVERTPWLHAPHGTLRVARGGALEVPGLLDTLLRDARGRGATFEAGWRLEGWARRADRLEAVFRTRTGAVRVPTRSIVLAAGPGYGRLPELRGLRLHPVKGQVVRVRPRRMPPGVLPVSGRGYAVPAADGSVVVGSSYEHDFDDSAPTRITSRRLVARLVTTLPWLRGATIVSEFAGLRVTVPGTRLPMVGPLPGHEGVWMLTGLGSKGLLLAPWLAECLPAWMREERQVPTELTVW